MRLRKLDLIRYGKFTDYPIEFGEAVTGVPDLHIIYGLNEAGKSTMLSAYLDLLFGIEHKSRYGFRHSYDSMEIGATLEIKGQLVDLLRNKSRKNSLRDSSGDPFDSGVLDQELAGLEREAYVTMFSLDDDSLEQGGESILSNQGHLGELLYSASSGVTGLTQRLERLQDEAESFYKPRGKNHHLGKLLAELEELKQKRNAISDKADQFAQLLLTRDNGQQRYDEVQQERTDLNLSIAAIDRLLQAKPRFDALNKLQEQLVPLKDLPEVPDNWSLDLPVLEKATTRCTLEKDTVHKNLAVVKQELDAITVDNTVLQLQDRINELDGVRTRHLLAMEQEPAKLNDLQSTRNSICAILEKLEQPEDRDPAELRFKVSALAALEKQIEESFSVNLRVDNARSELDRANQSLAQNLEAFEAATGQSGISENTLVSMQALERAIAPFAGSSLESQLSSARRDSGKAEDELQNALVKLRPWTGTAEELAAINVPAVATLGKLDVRLEQAREACSEAGNETTRLEDELGRFKAEVQAITETAGVVNDAELSSLRERRNEAWKEHRSQLSDGSADVFEHWLAQDDQAQSARVHKADAVANLNQSTRSLIECGAGLARARDKQLKAAQQQQELLDAVEKEAVAISPMLKGLSVADLVRWLDTHENALSEALEAKKLERDTSHIEDEQNKARLVVQRALQASDLTASNDDGLGTLLETARTAINSAQQLTGLQRKVEDDQRRLETRKQDLEAAESALALWQQDWHSLCASCWLSSYEPAPSPKAVKEIIAQTRELEPLLQQRERLLAELEALRNKHGEIAERVASLAGQTGLVQQGLQPDERFEKLLLQLKQELGADAARKEKLQQLKKLQSQATSVEQDLALNAETSQAMYRCLGVTSLDAVREKLEQVRDKKRLEESAADETKQLLEILHVASPDAARSELESFDRQRLEQEREALKSKSSDLDQRGQELYSELDQAIAAVNAIGSDSDVALLEEQREVLELEIIDKTRDHLAQRLGILATEKALGRYRDTHRSSMLQQASEAFATISRGAYSRLETVGSASAEKLIGITSDGSSKDSGDMSKGTRFQLYLALRVAGYHEYLKTRSQLPFIADDIMETFDDERASEAFKVFTGMAEAGQVIYLTHHEHLCDIARSVCPSVRIHELNDAV